MHFEIRNGMGECEEPRKKHKRKEKRLYFCSLLIQISGASTNFA
jgi:hypothetical protein